MGYIILCMEEKNKKQISNRLKRIEGQVRGLQGMLDSDAYCIDVITQSSAIRHALSSFEDSMLENHLTHHVVHQMRNNQEKKAISEILKVFKTAKKK